jgi:hypothetical protein
MGVAISTKEAKNKQATENKQSFKPRRKEAFLLSTPGIIGIVIAVMIAGFLLAFGIYMYVRYKRNSFRGGEFQNFRG